MRVWHRSAHIEKMMSIACSRWLHARNPLSVIVSSVKPRHINILKRCRETECIDERFTNLLCNGKHIIWFSSSWCCITTALLFLGGRMQLQLHPLLRNILISLLLVNIAIIIAVFNYDLPWHILLSGLTMCTLGHFYYCVVIWNPNIVDLLSAQNCSPSNAKKYCFYDPAIRLIGKNFPMRLAKLVRVHTTQNTMGIKYTNFQE